MKIEKLFKSKIFYLSSFLAFSLIFLLYYSSFIKPEIEIVGNYSEIAIIYHSPTCICCEEYEEYLIENGIQVKSVETFNMEKIKKDLGIPKELWSCHTTVYKGYIIEGHVPIQAIKKLLEEKSKIKGISLPGMPSGAPGMGGNKIDEFYIYSFNSNIELFIKV